MTSPAAWPAVAGSYQVGNPQAAVAVCALTSDHLIAPLARLAGVAIAGKVHTANLGIERIVVNVTANPSIRFLLLCGKDSPIFRPGQSLVALAESGLDEQRRIIGSAGYEPFLRSLASESVAQFRGQIEVVDWTGEEDLSAIERGIAALAARNPGAFASAGSPVAASSVFSFEERFTPLRPGGQREPLQYDPKGYFVITLDRQREEILLRHYLPDHVPAHEMRGRSAGPMLLGLLREGLVSQLSHAGYLGEELAKAQAALHLDLRYDQDRPLRPREMPSTPVPSETPPSPSGSAQEVVPAAAPSPMPPSSPAARALPMTLAQLQAVGSGEPADVVLAVADLPAPGLLSGSLLEPDEAELFVAYRRATHSVGIRWTPATRIAMGDASDLRAGALVRARGTLGLDGLVDAQALVILTRVARILE